MVTDMLTFLRDIRDNLYDAILLPGHFLLSQFAVHAPGSAMQLGINSDDVTVLIPLILSLVSWFLLALAVSRILKLWQNAARIMSAKGRSVAFRISLAAHNIKMSVVLIFRRRLPKRRSSTANAIPMVEFDDLDLAVLRYALAQGPGFAVSAPELAERFSLRPAQVQLSLDKLNKNRMLDYVIGSTDGFDNYRLTDSGAAFVAMWRRQATST